MLKETNNTNAPKVKADFVSQFNKQQYAKIRKDIYSKFVANTTDHEILCIIKPYMFSKQTPRMNIESSHRMVLDRIRKGIITTADKCVYNPLISMYFEKNLTMIIVLVIFVDD